MIPSRAAFVSENDRKCKSQTFEEPPTTTTLPTLPPGWWPVKLSKSSERLLQEQAKIQGQDPLDFLSGKVNEDMRPGCELNRELIAKGEAGQLPRYPSETRRKAA